MNTQILTMRRILNVCLLTLLALPCLHAVEGVEPSNLSLKSFEGILVHEGGRLKPVDTFARSRLLGMQEKQNVKGTPAVNWLLQSMLDRSYAFSVKTFTIRSPTVLKTIGVSVDKDSRYSLAELKPAMIKHESLIRALGERDPKLLDEAETQLVQKYHQVSAYMSMVHSLSCFWPDIKIDDPILAEAFAVDLDSMQSYYFFASRREALSKLLVDASKAKKADPLYDDAPVARLWRNLNKRLQQESATDFPIIPTVTTKGVVDAAGAMWRSPWEVLDDDGLNDQELEQMDALNAAVAAYLADNQTDFDQHLHSYELALALDQSGGLEVFYNKADLFYRSLYFYIASFLLLMVYWLSGARGWYKTSLVFLSGGAVLHFSGVLMRMVIMGSAPVSTLYESVIFACLISVLLGIAIELWRKDTWALLTACVLGILLQFIGFSFASEGDTMGMLEAVLNSVFWLSTHVVTIIIGYGVAMVAGILGHILLARYIFCPMATKENQALFKTARGVALVALFFTTLGTILGGIWADQSWGRFWGWDPKENGAMLIVLWLLIAIHGYIAGELKQIGFAMFLALTNICVAIAWFGVNLLSVGLHSYGFNNKTAVALGSFCLIELILVLGAAALATYKRRQLRLAAETN